MIRERSQNLEERVQQVRVPVDDVPYIPPAYSRHIIMACVVTVLCASPIGLAALIVGGTWARADIWTWVIHHMRQQIWMGYMMDHGSGPHDSLTHS